MSEEFHHNIMMLIIGRPLLNGQWEQRSFLTRDSFWQEYLRMHHYQVRTCPVPPFFDVQAARQLLTSSTNYPALILKVSLLELDHQQCATIVNGITTLLDNLPESVGFTFDLEYETGNPEHQDAIQQARDVVNRRFGCYLLESPNVQIEANSDMSVKGDDSPPTDDSPPAEDD